MAFRPIMSKPPKKRLCRTPKKGKMIDAKEFWRWNLVPRSV